MIIFWLHSVKYFKFDLFVLPFKKWLLSKLSCVALNSKYTFRENTIFLLFWNTNNNYKNAQNMPQYFLSFFNRGL